MIRRATDRDFNEIVTIAREAFRGQPEQLNVRKLHNAVKYGHILYVSEDQKPATYTRNGHMGFGFRKLVTGFVLCENDGPYQFVTWIAVRHTDRGKGIGRKLMSKVDGPAFAWVWHTNQTSQQFFGSLGFALKRSRKDGWRLYQRD